MKKLVAIIVGIIFHTIGVYGQNLVPNGNFELYINCPNSSQQISHAQYWSNPLVSPWPSLPPIVDYFNTCSISLSVRPPDTFAGFQTPKSGNGYVGFYTYGFDQGIIYREYVQTPLIDTLEVGKDYYVEFSCAQADFGALTHSCVGVLFTDDSLHYSNQTLIIDTPSVSNVLGNTIQDTALWYTISGVYTAKGTERYLCLGNFVADSLVDTITSVIGHDNAGCNCAYFFFDDVIVSKITGLEESVNQRVGVYPNPASKTLTINNILVNTDYRIVDQKGSIIQKGKVNFSEPIINIESLPTGSYILVLKDKAVSTVKFIKN